MVSGVLRDVTTMDAISSVYYANRLLDFRKRITSPSQNLRVPGVRSEPSDADVETAWKLIREIEQAEKTRLQDLNEKQAGKYVVALSSAVGQRTRREYSISAKTKQDLVKKAVSRLTPPAPSGSHTWRNTKGAPEFGHGTIPTALQGKEAGKKHRGRAAGSVLGKPKKAPPGQLLRSEQSG